jgi:hypothetical protein
MELGKLVCCHSFISDQKDRVGECYRKKKGKQEDEEMNPVLLNESVHFQKKVIHNLVKQCFPLNQINNLYMLSQDTNDVTIQIRTVLAAMRDAFDGKASLPTESQKSGKPLSKFITFHFSD